MNFAIGGTNADDFKIDANTCPASLAVSVACTVGVTFTPTATGARTASLIITDDAGGSPQSVTLNGTGEASQNKLALSTTALTFGANNLETVTVAPVVLTNSGSASIHLSGYSVSGANAGDFSISQNTCASADANVLAAGGSCTITLTFTPTAVGLRIAALQIADDASGSPQTVQMDGSGQTVARAVALSPSTVTFGGINLGNKGIQTLSVINTGDAAVTFSNYAISGANAGDFVLTGNTCAGNALAAHASCLLTVTFTAAGSGARSATITISDNATGSSQSSLLAGVGQNSAQSVSVLQPGYDFGVTNVGAVAQSIALSILNTGNGSVTFSSYAISGTNASDFTVSSNTCSSADANVLAAGNASLCSLTVTFKPSQTGVRTATLVISDSAPGSPHSIALTGVGQTRTRTLALSPATYYDFGALDVGASVSANFTVTNTGTDNLTFSKFSILGANAGEFIVTSNDCITSYSTVLNPNYHCSVSLTFTPGAAGIRTASLIIFYNGSSSPQTISLKGEGHALKSSLQVSTTNLLFTSPLGSLATTKNVYITNTGVGERFFGNASIGGANAADFAVSINSCQSGYYPATGVPAGYTCFISVSFTPSAAGTETATLSVTDSNSATLLAVTLTGLVQDLQKTLAVDADYHAIAGTVGSTSQLAIYLTSVSTGPVTLSALSISGAAEFTIDTAGSSCAIGQAIPAGSECTLYIDFSPAAEELYTAALQITDNASNSTQKVVLEGAGQAAGASLLGYGGAYGQIPVNTTSAQFYEFFVNNYPVTLTLGSPTIVGPNAADIAITSSSCGAPLAQYGSCSIYFTVTPLTAGPLTAAIALPYSGGTGTVAYNVIGADGSGGGGSLALGSIALEFDQTDVNSTNIAQYLQVTNTGTGPITFSPFTFSGTNASDFNFYQETGDYRTCTNVVPPGATCRVWVQFTPSGSGLRSAVMQVNGDAPNMPQSVSLIGEGQVASELLFTSTPSVDFGSQNIDGGSSTATVSLASEGTQANIGLANLQITGVNAAEFTIASTSCGNVLSTTCQVQIMFAPAGLGMRNANLVVTSDAPGSPLTIPLYGVGQPVSMALAISNASIDFGLENLNAQNLRTINLNNQGNSLVSFSLPSISGANATDFVVAADNCDALASGAYCNITVAFTPSAVGERTAALQINDSAAGSPQTVSLFGTGQIVSHLLSASAATLDFGGQSIGVPSSMLPVQISNTGTSPVAITGITLSGSNAADFIIDALGQGNCADVLAAGATCTINLQFDASVTGPETATLKLSSNSAAGSILVSLLGEGQKAVSQLSASTLTLDLGGQTAGTTSATGTVNVTNTGDTLITFFPASISGPSAGNFALGQGTCTNTLAPGSVCGFGVTFTPTSSGVVTAVLQINSTATASPLAVSLTGTGK